MHACKCFIEKYQRVQQMTIANQKKSSAPSNYNWLILFFILLVQTSPPAITAQPVMLLSPPGPIGKKSMAGVMAVIAIVFFITGFLSLYTRQCANQRTPIRARLDLALPILGSRRRSHSESSLGLDPEVIQSFPTFPYASVKGLKIGGATLVCAVCLDEFQDDETLRLIPRCSHVFHSNCIDVWLSSHSTCPVCRANLVPMPEVMPSLVTIQISDDQLGQQSNDETAVGAVSHDQKRDDGVESAKENLLRRSRTMNQNRTTPRSWSTGFLFAVLFQRSKSTGHSVLVQPGENCERFTLRLPEEVRSQLLKSKLKRTNSCMSFRRMSSGRKGYRTRSLGSGSGGGRRSFLQCQYERFQGEEQWGFTWRKPFFGRNNVRSPVQRSAVASNLTLCERSSDHLLCPGNQTLN